MINENENIYDRQALELMTCREIFMDAGTLDEALRVARNVDKQLIKALGRLLLGEDSI